MNNNITHKFTIMNAVIHIHTINLTLAAATIKIIIIIIITMNVETVNIITNTMKIIKATIIHNGFGIEIITYDKNIN